MTSQFLGAKSGLTAGGCLFAIGISGGIVFSNTVFGIIGLLGIIVALSSLAIFGLILPILEQRIETA